jgi:hypothetical protein
MSRHAGAIRLDRFYLGGTVEFTVEVLGAWKVRDVPTRLDPIFHLTQGLRPGLTHSAPYGAAALALAALLVFF